MQARVLIMCMPGQGTEQPLPISSYPIIMQTRLWNGLQNCWKSKLGARRLMGAKSAADNKAKPVKEKQKRALSKIAGTGKQEIVSFAYPEK